MFRRHHIIAGIILALLIAPLSYAQNGAQSGRTRGTRPDARANKNKRKAAPAPPPAVVKREVPAIISGDQNILVSATTKNILDIGLAKYGVCIIEYPETDSLYMVHPGDEKMVTVDRTGQKPHDPLVIRPGEQFVVPVDGSLDPSTVVSVQMGSGAVFTFRIYPVKSVLHNANRVVLSYRRDDIVRARIDAGLAVNYKPLPPSSYSSQDLTAASPVPSSSPAPAAALVQPSPAPAPVMVSSTAQIPPSLPVQTVQASSRPTQISDTLQSSHSSQPSPLPVVNNRVVNPTPASIVVSSNRAAERPTSLPAAAEPLSAPAAKTVISLREKMKDAVANPKGFSRSSQAIHGLSLSITRPLEFDGQNDYVVIAVRNRLKEPIRLVPGQPDFTIETLNGKKVSILSDPVAIAHLETTMPINNILAAGGTAYFAVAYSSPILDTHQTLRISIAQTLAADEPAIIDLSITSR